MAQNTGNCEEEENEKMTASTEEVLAIQKAMAPSIVQDIIGTGYGKEEEKEKKKRMRGAANEERKRRRQTRQGGGGGGGCAWEAEEEADVSGCERGGGHARVVEAEADAPRG